MSHLSFEDLARLVDERATDTEAAHLASCEVCRTELDAMREDVQALALLPDLSPAPDAWDALEARLLDEGLMRRRTLTFPAMRYMQAAAAILLLVGGTAIGRATAAPDRAIVAQLDEANALATQLRAERQDLVAQVAGFQSASGVVLASDAQYGEPELDARPAPQRPSPVSFASSGGRLPQARSVDEAASLLRQTEEWYLAALTRYAELTTQSDANDPIARLAALQSIVMTTQAALSQTPSDPVVNGAHLTAVAQRDAALRQVAATTGDRWH